MSKYETILRVIAKQIEEMEQEISFKNYKILSLEQKIKELEEGE